MGINACRWWVRRKVCFARNVEVKQHWQKQACIIQCSSYFSSQRKKRLEEILCCA